MFVANTENQNIILVLGIPDVSELSLIGATSERLPFKTTLSDANSSNQWHLIFTLS
jgi:hypothetical protein